METAKYQSKDSLKRPPPHRLFHRISIYVRTIFCWDRASFMLASRQSFIGSASAPVSFALDSRRFHVSFASDSRRNRRKHAAKDRSAAPLERAASGADAPLRWQRKNRAPTLPSTRTMCSRPHPHADALAAKRDRFTASARGCPAPPATASRYYCRQRGSQASARTC